MKSIQLLFLATGLFMLQSCGDKTPRKSSSPEKEVTQSKLQKQDTTFRFHPPVLPEMIKNTPQATGYLAMHYWDKVDFADTAYVHHNDVMEQAWANYCDLLNRVSPATSARSIRHVIKCSNASRPMFRYFTGLAEKYLYEPNSPLRNEEHYIPVLQEILASPLLDKAHKIRPAAQLKLALRNRVGDKGANFHYTLATGQQSSLYRIKADYTLIFFNDPDCHACRETISLLHNAPVINRLINTGTLKILSLYPDDEIAYWRMHLTQFPTEWIRAYDKGMTIRKEQIYDLKALPTLYLLDKKKNVRLKDATPQQVEAYLSKK